MKNFTQVLLLCVFTLLTASLSANSLTVLTYHDVVADPGDDRYAVSRSEFVAQMDYLKDNAYKPLSLAFLNKVRKGSATLPQKAILLSFDDGLSSYHDFVVPILKIYNYPSVAALVTGWLDGNAVPHNYKNKMMTWKQIKKLAASDLVEFISHTHSLHRGVISNEQGNERPAVVTRQFFPFNQSYETISEYRQRLKYDLGVSVLRFVKELGKAPLGIAWPYGKYNRVAIEEASKLGMVFQLTLEDGPTKAEQFPILNRLMLIDNPSIEGFANELAYAYLYDDAYRFVEVTLDPFIGLPKWKQEEVLGRLLDELQRRQVNMVVVSPFSQDFKKAFFSNDQMPVGADVLNRVIHQMQDRVPIKKIIVNIPGNLPVENIDRLYEDLASFAFFNGVMFSGKVDKNAVSRVKRVMGQYLPRLEFGHLGTKSVAFDNDFIVYPMHAASAPQQIKTIGAKLNKLSKKVYVMLRSGSKTTPRELKTAIQSLQIAGVKHYGYHLDTRYYVDKDMASN